MPGRVFKSRSHALVIDRDRVIVEHQKDPIKPIKIPETGHYYLTDKISFKFDN